MIHKTRARGGMFFDVGAYGMSSPVNSCWYQDCSSGDLCFADSRTNNWICSPPSTTIIGRRESLAIYQIFSTLETNCGLGSFIVGSEWLSKGSMVPANTSKNHTLKTVRNILKIKRRYVILHTIQGTDGACQSFQITHSKQS